MESDTDFFARRVRQEQLAATCAADPRARKAHAELAELYESSLSRVSAPTRSRLCLVA